MPLWPATVRTAGVRWPPYTESDDFEGAAVVLSDLGEPTRPATVLADPWGVGIGGVVDVGTLCFDSEPSALPPEGRAEGEPVWFATTRWL